MTCRQAQIGSAITSYVLHSTDLQEQQVLSLYHEVMREGRDAGATTPGAQTVRLLAANLVDTIDRDTTLTAARRESLFRRLNRAATETIDGSRHYATVRLMERAQRAEIAMNDYVSAAARDTGLTEDEVRAQLTTSRARAGADRSIRPGAGFIDRMRADTTTSDLPLDRQTAVAVEAMEATRANTRAAQPTRSTVTRYPVNSSAIAEMGYDDATGRVEVVLNSNPDVPYAYRMTREEWNEFTGARSVGSYYATNVRGNDAFRYADDTSARAAGTQTRCATCGEFADTSHACAPRGSEQEREQTEQRARTAARRPRRRVITPTEAEQAAAETPEATPVERVARRRVVLPQDTPDDANPTRMAGSRRNYNGQSGSFATTSLTAALTEARRNTQGVRVPITSRIAAVSGPDGPVNALHSNGRRGVVTGNLLLTYNGRGRGYTVTNENPGTGEGIDRLRCTCPDYPRAPRPYDCVHVRQTVQDLTTRVNADSLRDYHTYGPAIETVNTELARDFADSQNAQQESRTGWQANPTYTADHAAFQADYRAAKALIAADENPVPYMTENATDGLGAPRTGRGFGVELEFVIPQGANRSAALAAIGRDLHAAGLTRTSSQQRYHSSSTYSRSHQGGWKFEQDCTVDGEIISPIMSDTPETWEAIAKVCEIVERHGGTVDRRAGSHVHVSAGNYDHTVENHNRLLASFAENEDLVYRLSSNPTASNTRNGAHRGPNWCRPNRVPSGGYRDVSQAQHSNGHGSGLNLQAVRGSASDHVEFRTFDGTLTPSLIQTQIKLALAMTESAFRDTDYQPGTHNPLGAHSSHNRATHGQTRRLTGDDWRQDVAGYKVLADRLFRRPEDKAQMTALLAWTRWQRNR